MLFTSYSFLGFFAALLALYALVPRTWRWPLLLGASYVFYLASGVENAAYILTTSLTVYAAGRIIGRDAERQKAYLAENDTLSREEKKAYKKARQTVRRRWLAGCLLVNLAILAAVKYGNFFLSNLNGVLRALGRGEAAPFLSLALPMGISFYTFQAIGYLIDVYRGTVKAERNFFRFALFVSFFPLVIQGPISRYGDLAETLYEGRPIQRRSLGRGAQRILWGYFKKLVIADRILPAVLTLTGDAAAYGGVYVLVGMVLYTVELYADFTGGIDITIGVAETLGVTVQENFRRPYFSKSLKEYWRRWHISMCAWFRDYVFYPVSTSGWMKRFTKFTRGRLGERMGRRLPVILSSLIVWFATGVWHGANWNFIVWGLANWAVLMASEELEPAYGRFHERHPGLEGRLFWRIFQMGRTFLLVCYLNLFDCYASVGQTLGALGSMLTVWNWSVLWDGALLSLGMTAADYAVAACGAAVMLIVSLVQRSGGVRERIAALPWWVRFLIWYGLFLAVLVFGAYGVGYDASQFIYNRF